MYTLRPEQRNFLNNLISNCPSPYRSQRQVPSFSKDNTAKNLPGAAEIKNLKQIQEFDDPMARFTQSQEFKDCVATTIAEFLKSEIYRSLSDSFNNIYLPMMESRHERFISDISRKLVDTLEQLDSSVNSSSVQNASQSITHVAMKLRKILQPFQPPPNVMKILEENIDSVIKHELADLKDTLFSWLMSQTTARQQNGHLQPDLIPQMVNSSVLRPRGQFREVDSNSGALSPEATAWNPNSDTSPQANVRLQAQYAQNVAGSATYIEPYNPTAQPRANVQRGQCSAPDNRILSRQANRPMENTPAPYVGRNEGPSVYQPAFYLREPQNPPGTYLQFGAKNKLQPNLLDKLFRTARVIELIEKRNIDAAFNEALCCFDLTIVMAACRTADPQCVFAAPCCLSQSTLLTLMQQLSTDLVGDTNLKCQYIEECIINLNKRDPTTYSYAPLVVGDVLRHLTNFVYCNPRHPAISRISLMIMAAKNILE